MIQSLLRNSERQNHSFSATNSDFEEDTPPWRDGWLNASAFAAYLLKNCSDLPPFKGSRTQSQLRDLSPDQEISSQWLWMLLESEFIVQSLELSNFNARQLSKIVPLAFARRGDVFLPISRFPRVINPSETPDDVKLFFLTNALPSKKLTKLQFVQELIKGRTGQLSLLLLLGAIPILLSAGAELLNQPLFDSIVPSGHIPVVLLIGVATLFFQGSGQIITSLSQQYEVILNSQIDLASKVATGMRFLNARGQDLPQRDVGSWRLTFSVASAFLGSLESLVISIPLAIFSLVVNLVVMGAYTNFSAIMHMLMICMVPSLVSFAVTYFSSYVSIQMMSQQSQLESIIYSVVKNIRGIWMTNSESNFEKRFETARSNMAQSLLKSGAIAATTDVLDKITTGLLYTYIYIEYYKSSTTPSSTQLSVGSLLVVYSAIGIISGALNSITHDLVSIFQTLPTYWTPNAIRDISSYVSPVQEEIQISQIILDELTYKAPGLDSPFRHPISLKISAPGSFAIMGPSGSGKSTLLKLMLGHTKPSSGSLRLFDNFGNDTSIDLYQSNVLVISQDLRLFGDHLRDVIDPSSAHSDQELENAASTMGLTATLDQLPLRWLTPINEFSRDLSLGQLQLFKLCRALLKRYSIILSDEPTCHLPEELHLQGLNLLNQNSDLHISVLHRQSGRFLFEHVLELNPDGQVRLTRSFSS